MAKTPARFDLLRGLARRRLVRLQEPTPEEWAKQVEEARKRGCELIRAGDVVVEIKMFSEDE